MDPALLKERNAFMARAKAQPVVEKRKKQKSHDEPSSKKHKPSSAPKAKPPEPSVKSFDYRSASGASQVKFSILAKIVKHMRTRHQQGDTHPLTLDEILDETKQLDIGTKNKHWLITESLIKNPKIKVVENGEKYVFKPKYDIRDKKGLLNLLKKHDLHGWGGILFEDIEEALPKAENALKVLVDHIVVVVRPNDKKRVLFYNDKYCRFTVDEEFQKLWRGVSVEGLDEKKIEEYLEKQGITSMQDVGLKKMSANQKRKRTASRKNKNFKKHNEHLGDLMQDYSDMTK
ncbi:hypothetical protein FSP39_013842 [Pinctada imbricata]|uniref:Transcription initiation factor IIE subunit beta n=1 Tax=Pinctada imbricata TaxID=66713 RepID=A0AA89BTX2_PINIB|nr:hypothetical protein FSP39_013842 [Pinctada imbricata]